MIIKMYGYRIQNLKSKIKWYFQNYGGVPASKGSKKYYYTISFILLVVT